MKIKKAGVSFKSLESSLGSWREDKVRGMEGEREGEAAGEEGSKEKRREGGKVWAKSDGNRVKVSGRKEKRREEEREGCG